MSPKAGSGGTAAGDRGKATPRLWTWSLAGQDHPPSRAEGSESPAACGGHGHLHSSVGSMELHPGLRTHASWGAQMAQDPHGHNWTTPSY